MIKAVLIKTIAYTLFVFPNCSPRHIGSRILQKSLIGPVRSMAVHLRRVALVSIDVYFDTHV